MDLYTSTLVQTHLTIEKLRRNLKARGMTLSDICPSPGVYLTNSLDLKHQLQRIGIPGREIDRLLELIVMDGSGRIDLRGLKKRMGRQELEEKEVENRNRQRVDAVKELMYRGMTSPEDAFRYVSDSYYYGYSLMKTIVANLRSVGFRS